MLLWTSYCSAPTPWGHPYLHALWDRFRKTALRQTLTPTRLTGRRQRIDHTVHSGTVYAKTITTSKQSTRHNRLIARIQALTINHA